MPPEDGADGGPEKLVALLVDLENVAGIGLRPIFTIAASEGRVVVRRAYGNAKIIERFRAELQDLAFDSQALFSTTRAGKNSSDIFLAIDAMDLLHTGPMAVFVLATGDTDFARLARRLREGGKRVVGVGPEHAGDALVQSCDRWETPTLSKQKPLPRKRRRGPAPEVPEESQKQLAQMDELVEVAFDSAVSEDGTVGGSKLHQAVQRLDPKFDYKRLGFSSFGAFLKSLDLDLDITSDKRGLVVKYRDFDSRGD